LSDIPKRFPATGTDSAVAITRAVTKHRIGLRLAFESGSLDPERLARAVRLSMDAQPILGCSFRTDESKAYWLRLPALDEASVFSVVQTADPDGAMDSFQADEIADEGPQAKAVLLRASGADHLGIKVSHVLADGQAAKQYAYLLADIYSRLGADPGYTPRPDLGHRPTGRDVWDRLSPEQRREARKAKSWANPTWVMPAKGESGRGLTYRAASLGPEAFSAVKAHGRLREATVNDMMLAAVFRACVEQFDPPVGTPLSLMCTADLRRYLPDPEHLPISNISISGSLDIERVDGESFDGTLRRVRERMVVWSKTCYGAAPAASAERLAGLGVSGDQGAPELDLPHGRPLGQDVPMVHEHRDHRRESALIRWARPLIGSYVRSRCNGREHSPSREHVPRHVDRVHGILRTGLRRLPCRRGAAVRAGRA
jgi:NRPS condensation-like uncharacterized protein